MITVVSRCDHERVAIRTPTARAAAGKRNVYVRESLVTSA